MMINYVLTLTVGINKLFEWCGLFDFEENLLTILRFDFEIEEICICCIIGVGHI
jgi:hypothetical protein